MEVEELEADGAGAERDDSLSDDGLSVVEVGTKSCWLGNCYSSRNVEAPGVHSSLYL